MAKKVESKPAPKKAEKKIEVQKEYVVVGREVKADMKKALAAFMLAVEASDLSVSRKRMVEKIVRTRLSKALAV